MVIKLVFLGSFAVLAIAFVLFYIYIAPFGNFLLVGFDGFRGINFLGSVDDVRGILITGGAISVVNIALAWVFNRRDRFLAHLLPFFNLVIALLILMAITFIVVSN